MIIALVMMGLKCFYFFFPASSLSLSQNIQTLDLQRKCIVLRFPGHHCLWKHIYFACRRRKNTEERRRTRRRRRKRRKTMRTCIPKQFLWPGWAVCLCPMHHFFEFSQQLTRQHSHWSMSPMGFVLSLHPII